MYTLYNGDCLEIMPSIPSGSIDAIITDLPYGTTACKWDTVIEFAPMWKEVKRVLKPNGVFITTASQPFTSALIMSNPKYFRFEFIWEKDKPTNFALANKQPMKYHENICVFYDSQPTYNKQMIERSAGGKSRCNYKVDHSNRLQQGIERNKSLKNGITYYNVNMKNPSSILFFGTGRRQDIKHPTQKPVALYEYLIKTYTNEGETVLDIAMGSGTTIEAAERTGRNSIGIEKDENIFQIATQRISQFIKNYEQETE